MANNQKANKEFFEILEEAQKEYEELNSITDLRQINQENLIEDYSQRDHSHSLQLNLY